MLFIGKPKGRSMMISNEKDVMGWLRFVGSLKSYVSFADYSLFYRTLSQKRLLILRSLLIVAPPERILTMQIPPAHAERKMYVCVCVRLGEREKEREREREREREIVCVFDEDLACACTKVDVCVCVCACGRERMGLCVFLMTFTKVDVIFFDVSPKKLSSPLKMIFTMKFPPEHAPR